MIKGCINVIRIRERKIVFIALLLMVTQCLHIEEYTLKHITKILLSNCIHPNLVPHFICVFI